MYLEIGTLLIITHMFYVCKGLNDIRMVYNGTLCGLNLDLWAPHLGLPIFQHNIRALLPGYSQCDVEVGEMFLNSPLHPDLIPFTRVDIMHIKSRPDKEGWDQDRTRVWERWAKNFMGLTESPYRSLQLLICVKFIAYGERKNPLNPFHLSHARLNLPADESYTHIFPWVLKMRSYGNLASEVFIYVYDSHIIAHSDLVYWQAVKIFFSTFNSLGIQEASRKRIEPSLTPVPWAGNNGAHV